MLVEAEISSKYLIAQLLEHHSIEYILQTIAEEMDHPEPEDFSRIVVKFFYSGVKWEDALATRGDDGFSTYPV